MEGHTSSYPSVAVLWDSFRTLRMLELAIESVGFTCVEKINSRNLYSFPRPGTK